MTARIDGKIPDLVSLKEAAEILGMTKQAAHKHVLKGDLPGKPIGGALADGKPVGGTWVFRRAIVEKLAEARKGSTDE